MAVWYKMPEYGRPVCIVGIGETGGEVWRVSTTW
jgi:hypothetical protein